MKRAFELLSRHAETLLAALLALVALGLAILQITSLFAPLVHEQHNWRQSDVFSVAYTFHTDGFDFMHPRIDFWRGKTGIVGMEAPVYPALVHFAMYFLGDHPRTARIVAWLCFALAMGLGASQLRPPETEPAVRRFRALCFVAFGLFSPMGIGEFRNIQPDGVAVSLTLASAAFCLLYSRTGKHKWLVIGVVVYSLAAMAKSPVLVAGPALWMLTFSERKLSLRRMVLLGLPFIVPLLAYFFWYRWAAELQKTYEELNPLFNFNFDMKEIRGNLGNFGLYRYVFGFLLGSYASSWVLFPTFVAGLVLGFRSSDRRVAIPMFSWLLLGVFFLLCFSYRTTVHWYYAMVIFPPVVYFGALGLSNLFELARNPSATGPLSRIAAFFSVFTLALTLVAGGAAAVADKVPAADGTGFDKSWFHATGLMILGGCAVAAIVVGIFVKQGWIERWRLIFRALVLVAGILSLPRAVHDVSEAFRFRSAAAEWFTFDEKYAEMRKAVDSMSTRADLFLVDGYQPYYLHMARRRGFAVDRGTYAASGGLRYYLSKGVRFYLHHKENPPVDDARRGKTPLAQGSTFELYCIDPAGC